MNTTKMLKGVWPNSQRFSNYNAPKQGTLKCHFHDASLTKVEQYFRVFAWLCDLNKSCSSHQGDKLYLRVMS